MSVAKRPFADLRNTYIVDNNDPGAFDKRYHGTPGTHTEQRCCRDRAPYMEGGEQWCHECETLLEKIWGDAQDAAGPVLHVVAMAVTYVPVFGTAISFAINMSVTLAEGGDIEEAVLDGIGGAIPGQPLSGSAFKAARSILNGKGILEDVIAGLPDPPVNRLAQTAITGAVSIVKDLASGKTLNDIAIREIYAALPDEGKKAMDVATRIAKGENIQDVIQNEAEKAISDAMQVAADYARGQGEEAVNRFIAESGYQGTMGMIPPELGDGLKAGILAGLVEKRQRPSPGGFDFNEKDVATHDAYAEKGRKIIDAGAKWKGRLLSDIRNGSSLTITIPVVRGVERPTLVDELMTLEINDEWRRGFEIAIGLCEGSQVVNQAQQMVRSSLGVGSVPSGFDAGQEIQFDRTTPYRHMLKVTFVPTDSHIQNLARNKPPGWKEFVQAQEASGVRAEGLNKGAVREVNARGIQAAGVDEPKSSFLLKDSTTRAWLRGIK